MLQRQLDSAFARQAGLNDDGIGPLLLHLGESGLEFLTAADPDRVDCGSGGFAAKLDLFKKRFGEGIGYIDQSGHAARRRQHVADQFDTLLPASSAVTAAIPVTFPPGRGRLAISPVPTGSPVSAMTIGISSRRLLCRQSGGREPSDNYIDFETDQLGRQFGKPVKRLLPPIETQIECFAPRYTPDRAAPAETPAKTVPDRYCQ